MARQLSCAPLPQPIDVDVLAFRELLEKFRGQPEELLRLLVPRYSSRLLSWIKWSLLPRTSLLNRYLDADDILQKGWMGFPHEVTAGGEFHGKDHFLAFMKVVMRRYTLQYKRDHFETQKRSAYREEALDIEKHDRPTPEAGPADRAELKDMFQHVFDSFPVRDRPFVQSLFQGLSVMEIVEMLHIPLRSAQRMARIPASAWSA